MASVRGRLALLLLVPVAAACGSGKKAPSSTVAAPHSPPAPSPSAPLRATFRSLTHTPKVNTPWRYVVGANPNDANGTAIQSTVHVRVKVNGVWDDFGANSFVGAYQDSVSWPPQARGKLLVFEATVQQGAKSKTFRFWLRPR